MEGGTDEGTDEGTDGGSDGGRGHIPPNAGLGQHIQMLNEKPILCAHMYVHSKLPDFRNDC